MFCAATLPDSHSCLLSEISYLVVQVVLGSQLVKFLNLKCSIAPSYMIDSFATSCNGHCKTTLLNIVKNFVSIILFLTGKKEVTISCVLPPEPWKGLK